MHKIESLGTTFIFPAAKDGVVRVEMVTMDGQVSVLLPMPEEIAATLLADLGAVEENHPLDDLGFQPPSNYDYRDWKEQPPLLADPLLRDGRWRFELLWSGRSPQLDEPEVEEVRLSRGGEVQPEAWMKHEPRLRAYINLTVGFRWPVATRLALRLANESRKLFRDHVRS